MSEQFNKLTPAEAERLALLLEELGEAQQAIGKILRHGYENFHPEFPHGPTNRMNLERELGDVSAAVDLMCSHKDINSVSISTFRAAKSERVVKYLHHQEWRKENEG